MRPYAPLLVLVAVAASALASDSGAQASRQSSPAPEFHFARLIYADLPQNANFRRGWWQQDWPEAETHFVQNLRRLTRVQAGESVTVRLTDPDLFDYPWLYATQVGYWDLGDEEIAQLREYLLRGGFLMADDFWGEGERQVFEATMARLFPDRPIVDIPVNDAVLHAVFSIDEFTQIPGLRHLGRLEQLPEPHWRGIYDDQGRLLIAMNHNQDVGDSWEEADTPEYPEPMTALGYRFGINYIVYAMTH
jgi:Domain of unknown function (DUF4159)